MTSRTHKEVFPFSEAHPELSARVGFGPMPAELRPRTSGIGMNRTVGMRPSIVSLSFVALGEQDPHEVRIELVEKELDARDFRGGEPIEGARWHQMLFRTRRARHVYGASIAVPIDEVSGNPFGLRISTSGRGGASMLVMDWQWGPWSGERPIWRAGR